MPAENDRLEAATGREMTYALLSALYSAPPPTALVESLCKGTFADEIGCDSDGPARQELDEIAKDALEHRKLETTLTAEHTRLFVLPGGVRPYESTFLDQEQRLGGRISIGVGRFYEYAGAEFTATCTDLPDHIGVETEFMKFLCGLEAQLRADGRQSGLRRCLDLQDEFLSDHLLRWYEPFCGRVMSETAHGFYRALAHLTMDFLGQEAADGRR